MADICDFTQPDGIPEATQLGEAVAALENGELTQEEVDRLENSFNNTEPIEECVADDQPPNESSPRVEVGTLTRSPSPNTIIVPYTVFNDVVSGVGEELKVDVRVTVDGQTVDTSTHRVNPGSFVNGETVVENVSPGSRTVCAELA